MGKKGKEMDRLTRAWEIARGRERKTKDREEEEKEGKAGKSARK